MLPRHIRWRHWWRRRMLSSASSPSAYQSPIRCMFHHKARSDFYCQSQQSQSYRGWTREGYACVERSKTEAVRLLAGRYHKGHATAHGPEPPHTNPIQPTGTQSCQRSILPHGAWPADHATQARQPFSKQQLLDHRLVRHPSYVS
eukprot:360479-Chlamydomonas_euryale.AAC.2